MSAAGHADFGADGEAVARPGGVPTRLATVRVPGVSEYDLYLKMGGTLKGTVTEKEGGKPVAGVTVRAQGSSGRGTRTAAAVTGGRARGAVALFMVLMVRMYQQVLAPHLPAMCRFEPSCSRYAVEAL